MKESKKNLYTDLAKNKSSSSKIKGQHNKNAKQMNVKQTKRVVRNGATNRK